MSQTDHPDFTDTDLSAWLDGELDVDNHSRVDSILRDRPEAAARLRLLAADRDALRARLEGVLTEPVPERLLSAVRRQRSEGPWLRAAAVAGLLVLGGVAGSALTWQWQGRQLVTAQAGTPAGWVQRAVYAHSVFTPEPRHPVEVRAQEEHLARWLTRRTDLPVKLFDLRDEGFDLMGGRLLPDAGGKSAQLMYENAQTKERVTVYLRKPDVDAPTTFRYVRQGDLGLFYWVEPGIGCALVGALPKERLLALAQSVYKQHEQAEAAGTAPPR
ncbi:MAG: anti-sigma factor [Aquincola sp.]|nr:anti-sigma factor [Aquincola sp.]MDH4287534.1 anti-sigma factor [Aquincola sp.]MDH5330172.1 anti-sigma factor [Aquincola sp.]